MSSLEIAGLILAQSFLIALIGVTATEIYKKARPDDNPLPFALACGLIVSALTHFATQPAPQDYREWCAFVLVLAGGTFIPAGGYSLAATMIKKTIAEMRDLFNFGGVTE